jgi:hypothetical protein
MDFEAAGGMRDYEGAFDNLADAIEAAQSARRYCGWFHIVDIRTAKIVAYDSGAFATFDGDKNVDAVEYRKDAEGVLQAVE